MGYIPPALVGQGELSETLLRLLPKQVHARAQIDRRVYKLLQAIDSRVGSIEWSFEQTCRELKLDISPAHAARLFKRSVGIGVREYAKEKRLSMAAELLVATRLSIKAIAADLGYRKRVDFSRRFKRQFRISPSRYRKAVG